jgi:hypothetical protein
VDPKDLVALTLNGLTKMFQPFLTSLNVTRKNVSLDELGRMLL